MKSVHTQRISVGILFVFMLVFSTRAFAIQEKFYSSLSGSQISNGASFQVWDDKFFQMMQGTSWMNDFANYNVTNRIALELDPTFTSLYNTSFTATCSLTVTHYNSSGQVTTVNPVVLTVSYDFNTGAVIQDKNVYEFTKGHFVTVTVNSITSGIPNALILSSEVIVNRYYHLDHASLPTGFSVNAMLLGGQTNEYELSWPMIVGAEEYDLEFVFINDYDGNNGYISSSALNYDFSRNSTRVTVKENFYRIPNVFKHGYLLYRVRPVGRFGTHYNFRKEGTWSASETGTIASLSSKVATSPLHSDSLNWAYSASYVESGKRFEGISYADGLSMPRQNIGKNNSDSLAIVQVTYYDHQGRPALGTLPAPTNDPNLKYRYKFNRPNANATISYSKADFDKDISSCLATAQSMHTGYGAAYYYSSSNAQTDGFQGYTPDAQGMPFVQIQYTPDGTSRANAIGAAGPDYQLDTDHTTALEYGVPSQDRLNRLFGTDAGWNNQYQANVITDANGQRVVTYIDAHGRVVATALSGESPSNMQALNSNITFATTTQVITPGDQLQDNSTPGTLSYAWNFRADVEGEYTFSYGIYPGSYEDTCLHNLCMDCVYDLNITIIDAACGNTLFNQSKVIGGSTLDTLCNHSGLDSIGTSNIKLNLTPGSYQIIKTLVVNEAAVEWYTDEYIERNECLLSFNDFYQSILDSTNFSGCNTSPCEVSCLQSLGSREDYIALGHTAQEWDYLYQQCIQSCLDTDTSYCQSYEDQMLADMMPGGQYGLVINTSGTYTATDALSIYNSSNQLPNTAAHWRNPTTDYVNEDGTLSYIYNSSGVLVQPEDASITLTEFITNFRPSWAKSLLNYHPERCYLNFCETQTPSHQVDAMMMNTPTYAQALVKGYLNPLHMYLNQGVPDTSMWNTTFVDPFYTNNASIQTQFKDRMKIYETFGSTNLSIWQMAWFNTYCNGDTTTTGLATCLSGFSTGFGDDTCTNDLLWNNFRNLYQQLKDELYNDLQAEYAIANECYSGCFGISTFDGNEHEFIKLNAHKNPDQPCSDTTIALYQNKMPRFYDFDQSAYDDLSQSALYTQGMNDYLAGMDQFCDSLCEYKVDSWMDALSACNLNSTQASAIRNEMLELCILGCDSLHAFGAGTLPSGVTTANGNSSIHDILIDVLGSSFESVVCSDLLITSAPSYANSAATNQTQNIDTCGCDKVLYVKELFYSGQPLPVGVFTMEDLFTYTYGYGIGSLQPLVCRCEAAWDAGYATSAYAPQLPWLSASASYLNSASPAIAIPAYMGCSDCSNCETINALFSQFNARFPGIDTNHVNYTTLLETFMNNALGYQLGADHYLNFKWTCAQGGSASFCYPNQELSDLEDLLTQLSGNNSFLTTSAAPVALGHFSAWAASTLSGYTTGNNEQFWTNYGSNGSPASTSDLTLYFGNTSPCNVVLSLEDNSPFTWEKLERILELHYISNGCNDAYSFYAIALFQSNTGLVSDTIYGTNSCYPLADCSCGSSALLCNEIPMPSSENPCLETLMQTVYIGATEAYNNYIDSVRNAFAVAYREKCIQAAIDSEYLNMSYPDNEYHHTLYYYDQAGNLVRTVPPAGTDLSFAATSVDANRPAGTRTAPTHTLTTEYRYNSFDQLTEQKTPDGGVSKFWYDKYGRIAVSQNAKQAALYQYSYIRYDALGRPYEVGQVTKTSGTPITESTLKDPSLLDTWITSGTREQVTRSVYDESLSSSLIATKFANGQNNLRNRISTVAYYLTYSASTPDTAYRHASHFSYDEHGNVAELIQDIPQLKYMGQQDKRLQYQYELVSGNVTKVIYQKDQADQFYHEYLYDKDNRIKEVYTSRDSTIWDKDAKYFYYKHGPLARVEHGQNKVQAEDYAYTINGWIKGVNSGSLTPTYDIGKDGTTGYLSNNTNIHKSVGYDKFGYLLGYYDGDYTPINALAPGSSFEPAYSGTTFDNAAADLFNGNIRHMITALPTSSQQTMGYTYQYDQLHRIKSMTAYHGMSSNSWSTGSSTTDYANNYSYDANGNILTLNRRGSAGLNMDELSYNYTPGTNQLTHVDDAYTSVYNDDIDDQSSANYTYTAIGELYSDAAENISAITWRVDGKVQKVQRNATAKTEMEFEYDAFGRRVLKIEKPTTTGGAPTTQDQWTYTYYVNDADGNVMAMYTLSKGTTNHDFKLENQHIHGNKRLGLLNRAAKLLARKVVSSGTLTQYSEDAPTHTAGTRHYEYSNHLQNVLLVTSDRKVPYYSGSSFDHFEPQIVSYQDYYPFGSNMPDRGSNAYLYGFNGMLKDDNLKGNGNSYDFGARIYDSRLGRWLSRDPLEFEMAASSTYSFSFNCPMFYIDYTGEKPTAYEAALMAQHVYDGTGAEELAKTGWKVSTEKFGLSAKDLADNNGEEGFKSQVYERTVNGVTEYAYVTAGTDDWEDIKEDIKAGTGNTKQYKKSIKNAKKISSKAGEKELTFIGHSLGGGMAAANAMATNRQAITFNPMGMTTILKAKLGILNVNSDGLVTNYIIFGEILYDAQHIILGIGYEGEIVYLTDGSVFVPIPSYHLYAILRAHTIGRVIEELKDEGYDNDTDQFTIMLNEIIVNSNSIQNEENQNSEQEQNCGTEECCEEE